MFYNPFYQDPDFRGNPPHLGYPDSYVVPGQKFTSQEESFDLLPAALPQSDRIDPYFADAGHQQAQQAPAPKKAILETPAANHFSFKTSAAEGAQAIPAQAPAQLPVQMPAALDGCLTCESLPLAMTYVRPQTYRGVNNWEDALRQGTGFPELYQPHTPRTTTKWGESQ